MSTDAKKLEKSKTEVLAGTEAPQLPMSATVSAVASPAIDVSAALANPTYSGFGTWLGTLISIIAAIVSFKQAMKAITAVQRIQKEQKRQYVESAHRHITRLDQVVRPIVLNGIPARGVDVASIVNGANDICHQLLSMPVDKILPQLAGSIKSIESSLSNMTNSISAAKSAQATTDPLHDLQRGIRTEIQLLSKSCIEYLDSNATSTI